MKKIFIVCLILLGSTAQSFIHAQSKTINKVIANVGGEYILYSELMEAYKYALSNDPTLDESVHCKLMDQLIAQKILVNQAKLDSIEVPEAEVEAQLDQRIQRILQYMNGDEERFKEYYNKTVVEFKDATREEMRHQILAGRIQGQLIREVNITPKEVVEFFEAIPKDSLPYLNAEVQLGEIIWKPQINEIERQKALDKITELKRRIVEDGDDFGELATIFSDDQGTGLRGGELGWKGRGSYVPEFEAALYSLQKGEISDPVETQFGFHIIQLNDRRGNSVNARHILVTPEITQQDLDLAKTQLDSIRNLISVDSISFLYAVKRHSDKDALSYGNNGKMLNTVTGDSYFQTNEISPPDLYFAIEGLEVGDMTPVIEYIDPQSQTTQYKLVKLLSRTKPHKANLKQDYNRIKNFAKESKKNEYYNNWIIEKLSSTYIELDKEFARCPELASYIKE